MFKRILTALGMRQEPGGPKPKARRSRLWPKVRKQFLKDHPVCAFCGDRDYPEVHHIQPYHLFPERELDSTNLVTLCDPGDGGCHRRFGHLFLWASYNLNFDEDLKIWKEKIRNRPK